MTRANDIASLVNASGVDVTGTITFDGGTTSADLNFGDSDKAVFGAGSDLQIYHDGSNSYISDSGTGDLIAKGTQLKLQDANGADYLRGFTAGAVYLHHNGSSKFETTSGGVAITGECVANSFNLLDNNKVLLGNGGDLQIYHNGSNSFIDDAGTGNIYLRGSSQVIIGNMTGEQAAVFNDNGAVTLNYDNVQKLATTSYGVDINGSAVADTHNVSSASGAYVQNFDTYQHFKYEMSGNVTLNNPTTEKAGQSGHMIFIQDATGGRTLSLGADYETVGGAGITLSSAPNATDIVPYVVLSSGRILLGTPQLAFA